MRQGKEISSVKNSIQTRLSGVMLLVLVFALGINVFIFKQIHTAVTRIDAVFSSNTAVNELSESLEQVESTVYEYLNTKSTQALENYYRYEQNYKNLIEELNDGGYYIDRCFSCAFFLRFRGLSGTAGAVFGRDGGADRLKGIAGE